MCFCFRKSSPLKSSDQVCFCLSLNIVRFSTCPYFFIRLENRFEGCKNDTLVCSMYFFDFLSCLKICWWWHILRLESYRISSWTSLSVSENLRCLSRVLECSNYNIQGIVSHSCQNENYLPVVMDENPVVMDENCFRRCESNTAWSIR